MPVAADLKAYRAKRNFTRTPEPSDELPAVPSAWATGKRGNRFVIQKHWASRLHYDFRLELDGTLKSWAVPKGPSLDPKDKRMAVEVEDHPVSYAGFEGTIPPRQYGAGKVIVWDRGSWHPLGDAVQGLKDGNLKFELRGHKLRGRWVLVRMKGKSEKQTPWLLIKEKDQHARPAIEYSVVDEVPDSVLSVAASREAKQPSPRLSGLPISLRPQLATPAETVPTDPAEWIFEIKLDGYRLLARIDGADIHLLTRNGHDWTRKLDRLHRCLIALRLPSGWYDGEIVVPDPQGRPDFAALQSAFDAASTDEIVYYLFDLAFLEGHDLRELPLEARRERLASILAQAPSEQVRLSAEFDAAPSSVLTSACRMGLEGVIAKRRASPYRSRRSADWLKLKCGKRQEFVIGGFTAPKGARAGLGALLLGVYESSGHLQHAGKVGSGFDQSTLRRLRKQLDALRTDESPFADSAVIEGTPQWVKPVLVAEVSFADWTRDGRVRHAIFKGLRADKPARGVVREHAETAMPPKSQPSAPVSLGAMRLTNADRLVDPGSGIRKIDVIRYYALVAKLMLPHLVGRPVSLVRAPSGIGGELFFQKHADTDQLPGVRHLAADLSVGHGPLLEVTAKRGLLSAAQWNVIEFHTVNAQAKSFAHPDRMVFDLDPGEGVAWDQVQEAATLLHSFLAELGLAGFLKTSGGKGLHVVIPIRKQYDWASCKGFAKAIVAHIAALIPQRFTARSGPGNRVGKIYIDYLRNGSASTTVCAWSARARPGMGISVPVAWDELDSLRGGAHWTLRSVHERLEHGNQPWAGYARAARSLTGPMRKLRNSRST